MTFKYAGFISYAHADEAIAARLHRALETYAIPKSLKPKENRAKLSPIFRDTTELTAHHSLSEKIREAVQSSRFLIVLCSPAAKASHWVNEEIRLFRSLHGEGSILCVLAEGTPEMSFPPALLEEGREPLAANLGESKESFRLGTTQLAASMLGVGLDVLIQRESKRRRRRLQLITASALVFSGLMGATALTAIEARNDAQDSRSQAEGLVEYMITDLKKKLEPVGRLDILDSVGDKAVEYYDTQNIAKLPDESLARQARSRHILGQVAFDAVRKDDAIREIEAAARLTSEVLNRNPDDSDAIFAHAQSEFWLGKICYGQGKTGCLLQHWTSYDALTQRLYQIDPNNINWIMEAGYGKANLGTISQEVQQDYERAFSYFTRAIEFYKQVLHIDPNHRSASMAIANSYAGTAFSASKIKSSKDALEYKNLQIGIYDNILEQENDNFSLIYKRAKAQMDILHYRLIPENSHTYNQLVEEISEAFKITTDRDPDNRTWKRSYKIFQDKFTDASIIVKNP